MNLGKIQLAQVMDFRLSTASLTGTMRTTGCERCRVSKQFRAMAFSQRTYRESLRDIEACLSAQAS